MIAKIASFSLILLAVESHSSHYDEHCVRFWNDGTGYYLFHCLSSLCFPERRIRSPSLANGPSLPGEEAVPGERLLDPARSANHKVLSFKTRHLVSFLQPNMRLVLSEVALIRPKGTGKKGRLGLIPH